MSRWLYCIQIWYGCSLGISDKVVAFLFILQTGTFEGQMNINSYSADIFLYKPWRPKVFFNLKS